MTAVSYDVVVPTIGRPSLVRMLRALAEGDGPWPEQLIVVDDRPPSGLELELPAGILPMPVTVLRAAGNGPAAARNLGWRAGSATWTVFLDDDVLPRPGWRADLASDLGRMERLEGGSQGRIVVPRPPGRPPTDWERNVGGLARARWATADMAYRRTALERVGGFDERFPRAYREDADLALRVREAGFRLRAGERSTDHPVRRAPWWTSVRAQVGNADDMLMRRVHGPRWRQLAEAGPGSIRQHVRTTAAVVLAVAALVSGRPRGRLVAGVAGGVWLTRCDILLRPPDPSGAADGCRDRGDGRDELGHPARCDVAPRARLAARVPPRAETAAGRCALRP